MLNARIHLKKQLFFNFKMSEIFLVISDKAEISLRKKNLDLRLSAPKLQTEFAIVLCRFKNLLAQFVKKSNCAFTVKKSNCAICGCTFCIIFNFWLQNLRLCSFTSKNCLWNLRCA